VENGLPGFEKLRTLVCLMCGASRDLRTGGRCAACGAMNWIDPSPLAPEAKPVTAVVAPEPPPARPPAAQHVPLSQATENMIVDPYDAELSLLLHGIRRLGTIVLAGKAGAGKSTLAAELAAAVAEEMDGTSYWLDRDQQALDLISAVFTRTGSPTDRVTLVRERDRDDPAWEELTWQTALASVPEDAACLVVDSLEAWAEHYAEQSLIARTVLSHGARVKVLIAGANKEGKVEGLARLERACDAVVVVTPKEFYVSKCRWLRPEFGGRQPRQFLTEPDTPP
jgi:predicted ATP-dependent serine protease